MKKLLCIILALVLLTVPLTGCNKPSAGDNNSTSTESTQEQGYMLNGVSLSEYAIVYSATAPDYTERAANYLSNEIFERTGILLTVLSDQQQTVTLAHEIVVGETNRAISQTLDAETNGLQFAILADDAHIAMEGDFFVIAAAAYYFMETYFTADTRGITVAKETTVNEPIVKEAKNFIFLIGDGMGVNQTKLFELFSAEKLKAYSDGETAFYGYMFPYAGFARTNSLSGVTDSAAGGTALATGYKTENGYVGKDSKKNDVKSLTEYAIELGKATAVMSTEVLTGATPAAFSAHTVSREYSDDITACQDALKKNHGTLVLGDYGSDFTEGVIKDRMEKDIRDTLDTLSQNENGFFMMYEEAYIDKHCHNNKSKDTFLTVLRFNQAIGCFMEFAFYNPETFVIITADHETGGLERNKNGRLMFNSADHTGVDVPVFAYGQGAEVFHGVTVENIQIPKTIAKMWGVELTGYQNDKYPALTPTA